MIVLPLKGIHSWTKKKFIAWQICKILIRIQYKYTTFPEKGKRYCEIFYKLLYFCIVFRSVFRTFQNSNQWFLPGSDHTDWNIVYFLFFYQGYLCFCGFSKFIHKNRRLSLCLLCPFFLRKGGTERRVSFVTFYTKEKSRRKYCGLRVHFYFKYKKRISFDILSFTEMEGFEPSRRVNDLYP